MTGATGFVGGRLARALRDDNDQVRVMTRRHDSAGELERLGYEVHVGDVLDAESLSGAGSGIEIAYYLVHSMGRGGDDGFLDREITAARNFAQMARAEGVARVVYLGGLGSPSSAHLRARQATADELAAHGPALTYFRAAMVVGEGSESFRTLYYLVKRLPVMVAPAWLRVRTQPIGIDDVVAYLAQARRLPATAGREIQIGGPDVMSYGEMLTAAAPELGRRKPIMVPVPFLTPTLSSLWIGLVTPVDTGIARPLVEGLTTETVVTDPSGAALFDVEPEPFAASVRRAVGG